MRKVTARILVTALAAFFLMGSAHANIVISLGNISNFQNVDTGTQTGMSIQGTTSSTGNAVLFSSTIDTLKGTSGSADIHATDGLINNITIKIPGFAFAQMSINPFKPAKLPGDFMVTATDTDGETFHFGPFGGNGENRVAIIATGGELISSVTITSAAGFEALRQTRFTAAPGGITPTPTPEPGTLELLGYGVLGLAGMASRKLKLWT